MSSASEAELMRRISAGDRDAYRTVLDEQLPSVSRYVIRMTGTTSEAEDITQEVFLRLWAQAERFDPRVARLSTWLHNIAHNLCIDYFRKHGRLVDIDPVEHMEAECDPESDLAARSRGEAVRSALMRIPERQRSALVMCHYQGLSNKEAALVMEVSVEALESLLARGRRNLKTLLQIHE